MCDQWVLTIEFITICKIAVLEMRIIMNYDLIYRNFKQRANYMEDTESPFFEKASKSDMEVLVKLYDTCLSHSAIWTKNDIDNLRNLKIPEAIIQFYQEMNPQNAPMNNAGIYLADLNRIRDEYSQLEPGCYLIKFGLIVIATTIGGNPIIADLYDENAGVFICDHNLLSCERENGQIVLSYVFPPDPLQDKYGDNLIPVNRDTLFQCFISIEKSFEIFITKLSRNEYEYDLEDLLE